MSLGPFFLRFLRLGVDFLRVSHRPEAERGAHQIFYLLLLTVFFLLELQREFLTLGTRLKLIVYFLSRRS